MVERTLPAETRETCRRCEEGAAFERAAERDDEPIAGDEEDGAEAKPTADRSDLRRKDMALPG